MEELETLPGVGPSTAEAIINFREENGPFKTIEDLMLVPGIKEGRFERMKDRLRVG
ncbi:MAG: helix-hairpin-helix domain-containing protein, partial [Clostridiaceae bacterium]|nr:helix-hairpin-helix domain-containing protein [Clostridiaceae bacterium]